RRPARPSSRRRAQALATRRSCELLSLDRRELGERSRRRPTRRRRPPRAHEAGAGRGAEDASRAAEERQPGGEQADEAPRPREKVLDGAVSGDRQQREGPEEGDRIPVHGPDEALEPVPAESGAPVQVRLEQRERDARRGEEDDAAHGDPEEREPRPLEEGARLEREPLAHGDNGEPEHGRREYGGNGQRNR